MSGAGIGKRAADYTWPGEFVRFEGGGGTDIWLGIETQARHLEKLADAADKCRIQVLSAKAVETGVAFDAFVLVNGGAIQCGIDIDGAHGADVNTISAGDTFIRIDLHGTGGEATDSSYDSTSKKNVECKSRMNGDLSDLITRVKPQA